MDGRDYLVSNKISFHLPKYRLLICITQASWQVNVPLTLTFPRQRHKSGSESQALSFQRWQPPPAVLQCGQPPWWPLHRERTANVCYSPHCAVELMCSTGEELKCVWCPESSRWLMTPDHYRKAPFSHNSAERLTLIFLHKNFKDKPASSSSVSRVFDHLWCFVYGFPVSILWCLFCHEFVRTFHRKCEKGIK